MFLTSNKNFDSILFFISTLFVRSSFLSFLILKEVGNTFCLPYSYIRDESIPQKFIESFLSTCATQRYVPELQRSFPLRSPKVLWTQKYKQIINHQLTNANCITYNVLLDQSREADKMSVQDSELIFWWGLEGQVVY